MVLFNLWDTEPAEYWNLIKIASMVKTVKESKKI